MLHFDWLIKKQYAKSKTLESREIIIAKTNFQPSKWQKENQNQMNKLYNIKLCEPKNILEKKGVLMLRHICYDTNGSAWKASGTLMHDDTLKILSQRQRHTEDHLGLDSTGTKYDFSALTNLTVQQGVCSAYYRDR